MSVAYIIDDHLDTAETFSMLLKSEGFHSAFFTDFGDALKAIPSGEPCLVFADYHNTQGMMLGEFMDAVRKLNPDLPIYVISGDPRVKEIVSGRSAGFLMKPVEISDVVAITRRHCSMRC